MQHIYWRLNIPMIMCVSIIVFERLLFLVTISTFARHSNGSSNCETIGAIATHNSCFCAQQTNINSIYKRSTCSRAGVVAKSNNGHNNIM